MHHLVQRWLRRAAQLPAACVPKTSAKGVCVHSGVRVLRAHVAALTTIVNPGSELARRQQQAQKGDGTQEGTVLYQWRGCVGQGGWLDVQLPDSELDVEILPVWDDSCSVELVARGQVGSADAGLHKEELVQVAASQHTEGTVPTTNVAITAPDTGLLHAASATLGATLKLQVQLPQIFNLRVNVLGNNVTAHDEIEGNVIIRSLNGNVSVRKVRGMEAVLHAPRGTVSVGSVVETGELDIEATRVQAKRLLVATKGDIVVHEGAAAATDDDDDDGCAVDIAALYGNASLRSSSTAAVHIAGVHGMLHGDVQGDASVLGVAGGVQLSSAGSCVTVGFSELKGDSSIECSRASAKVAVAACAPTRFQYRIAPDNTGAHPRLQVETHDFGSHKASAGAAAASNPPSELVGTITAADRALAGASSAGRGGMGKISAQGRSAVTFGTAGSRDVTSTALDGSVFVQTASADSQVLLEVVDWPTMMQRKLRLQKQ